MLVLGFLFGLLLTVLADALIPAYPDSTGPLVVTTFLNELSSNDLVVCSSQLVWSVTSKTGRNTQSESASHMTGSHRVWSMHSSSCPSNDSEYDEAKP